MLERRVPRLHILDELTERLPSFKRQPALTAVGVGPDDSVAALLAILGVGLCLINLFL